MSWLDRFFSGGIKNVAIAGALLPQEVTLNFASGATGADNPSQSRSDITINVLAAPTGTGFVHITSGGVDAAARAINLASADVTGVLGTANGGTGLSTVGGNTAVLTVAGGVPAWSTTGSNGQILTITGGAVGWAASPSSFTPGADISGNGTSTGTAQYVSSISYSNTVGGGPVAINGTGTTFVIAQNSVGFSLSQTAAPNTTAPVGITIQPQFAGATPTSNSLATPGALIVNFGPATNNGQAGTEGAIVTQLNGSPRAAIGTLSGNTTNGAVWFGNVSRILANAAVYGDGSSQTIVNNPSTIYLEINGVGSTATSLNSSGLQLFSSTFSLGGGVGVVGLTNAPTVPTSNPTGGGILFASGGNLVWWGPSGPLFSTRLTTQSANYTTDSGTAPDGEIWADSSGGSFNITVSASLLTAGRVLWIWDKTGSFGTNPVTLVRHGTETIDGIGANKTLNAPWGMYRISSDGTNLSARAI